MPNRISRETVCTSESLAQLSPGAERLFHRLVVTVDDFGRFDGRPAIIRGRALPIVPDVTDADVAGWLRELVTTDTLREYTVEGKPYIYFPAWGEHQRTRASKSKYPPPSDSNRVHVLPDVAVVEDVDVDGNEEELSAARMTDNQKQADVLLAADSRPQYLLGRLIETDARWAKVTPARLMGLSKQFGPAIVISAVEFISETKPALTDSDPYGYLQTVCRSRKEAS